MISLSGIRLWTTSFVNSIAAQLPSAGTKAVVAQNHLVTDQPNTNAPAARARNIMRLFGPPKPPKQPDPTEYVHDPVTRHHFEKVYANATTAEAFAQFFVHVFSILPPQKFDALIHDILNEKSRAAALQNALQDLPADSSPKQYHDFEVFLRIVERLPEITPAFIAKTKMAIATLNSQRQVLSLQTARLVGSNRKFDGYMEVGTKGDYVGVLKDALKIEGPIYLASFVKPTNSPQDMVQRGQIKPVGKFISIRKYAPIPDEVPDNSVDLITVYIGLHHIPAEKITPFIASLARVLRPGGKLVLRDHDTNEHNESYVHLAHATFNAGIGSGARVESRELRNFQPLQHWIDRLSEIGLKAGDLRLAQEGDPTDNLLISFTKPLKTLEDIKIWLKKQDGYAVPENQSVHRVAEWDQVFRDRDYADFLDSHNYHEYPYVKANNQYIRVIYDASRAGGWNLSMIGMNLFIGPLYMLQRASQAVLEAVFLRHVTPDPLVRQYAREYAEFIHHKLFYDYDFDGRRKEFNRKHPGFGAEKLVFNLLYGATHYMAQVTKRINKGGETTKYGGLIYDPKNNLLKAVQDHPYASQVIIEEDFGNGYKRISLPPYKAYSDLVQKMARAGIQIADLSGNEKIALSLTLKKGQSLPADLPGSNVLFRFPSLTKEGYETVVLQTELSKMTDLLAAVDASQVAVQHVYQY